MSLLISKNDVKELACKFKGHYASEDEIEKMTQSLVSIGNKARLPKETEYVVLAEKFSDVLLDPPKSDLNIFGIAEDLELSYAHTICDTIGTSSLFVRDSGSEKAFA